MDKNLKSGSCPIIGCDGDFFVSNTNPSKLKKLIKLKARCTKCGYHSFSTPRGQALLSGYVGVDDDVVDAPDNALDDDAVVDDDRVSIHDKNKQVIVLIGALLVLSSTFIFDKYISLKNEDE